MALLNTPPENAVDEQGGRVNQGWAQFFSNVSGLLTAVTLSGTTAQRPTSLIWIGRPYFDTSLAGGNGMPIWVSDVTAGVVTWVDATGTPA
jgi:hypothetical protein